MKAPFKSRPDAKKLILLVDDDPLVRKMTEHILLKWGFEIQTAGTGRQALRKAESSLPNLILLDWVLGSEPSGIQICARLKSSPKTRAIPIVVLTGARIDFQDELSALSHGADLYLTKDAVLGHAKKTKRFRDYVRALLDRPFKTPAAGLSRLPAPGIAIDLANHTVKVRDREIEDLPTKLFDLLYLLAKHHPRIVSRRYLVRNLWKNSVQDREVDVAICRLKSHIEAGKDPIIESVVGRGYRLRFLPVISGGPPSSLGPAATGIAN